MFTGAQCRAARGLVDWTRDELARAAKVSPETVKNIEHGVFRPQEETAQKIIKTFETEGVEFTEDEGVKIRTSRVTVYEGPDRFNQFYDFLYEHTAKQGGEVCLMVVDEGMMAKYRTNPEMHRKRMRELVESGRVTCHFLVTVGDFVGNYAEYRVQPPQAATPTAFYAFGKCLALISFPVKKSPHVVVIESEPLTQAYVQAFHAAWEKAKPHKVKK
jgi:DNA-binding XRE family transcriptional regulator